MAPIASIKRGVDFSLVLDLLERAALVILFGILTINLLHEFQLTGKFADLLLIASEGSVVLFTLFRRLTTTVSLRPLDWLTATLGTVLPLLVQPTGFSPVIPSIAIVGPLLMLSGLTLQVAAKLTLRRSFGIVAANRGVKVGGPYRIVRHPMYAGYVLTHIGFLFSSPSLSNFCIYSAAFAFQLARILAEERILSEDEAYRDFADRTRYRLVPGVY